MGDRGRRFVYVLGTAVVIATATVVVSGCGGERAALDAAGEPLPTAHIYLSVPLTGPLGARGRDMADAARLALKQTKFNAGDRPLKLVVRDSAPAKGGGGADAGSPVSTDRVAATARTAAEDANALAVIGDLTADATAIVKRQTDRSRNLVVSLAIAPTEPKRAERVATRVVWLLPSKPLQLFALEQARAHQPASLIPDDPSQEVRSTGVAPLELVSPALLPEQFPPGGARFYQQFENEYDRRPDRFAIFAFDALGLVDQAIQKAAADAEDRATNYGPPEVAAAALRVRDRFSAVGHYDILPSGQSTLYQFTVRDADEPPNQSPEDLPRVIEARR